MNADASQAITRLTVNYERLIAAIANADNQRLPPNKMDTAAKKIMERTCQNMECYTLDQIIKSIDALASRAYQEAVMLEYLTGLPEMLPQPPKDDA
jgi:hypothetical protein